ncbi:MAG: 50S ribosomal protein L20 [Dehalococcoidia bacterium]|nr:50S ribosomal protein L20 [Dehalococcoidia bacterium]
MPRTRNRVQTHRRHKKIFNLTKGHRGKRRTNIKVAHESMIHALRYSTEHRRDRKGDFRKLWIIRINAAARQNGLKYGELINGLNKAGVEINRKMLADLAVKNPTAFSAIADQAKAALQA